MTDTELRLRHILNKHGIGIGSWNWEIMDAMQEAYELGEQQQKNISFQPPVIKSVCDHYYAEALGEEICIYCRKSRYENDKQSGDAFYDALKRAFEAGQAFENQCNCGKCDYCIEVKEHDEPDFENWYKHFR